MNYEEFISNYLDYICDGGKQIPSIEKLMIERESNETMSIGLDYPIWMTVTSTSGTLSNWEYNQPIKLDCLSTPGAKYNPPTVAKEEKEHTMYHGYEEGCCQDQTSKAQNYLDSRLDIIKDKNQKQFDKDFGLVDDDCPITPKDLIERITSGKYIVPADKMEVNDYDPLRRFRWRDPSKKEDRSGYDATMKKMNEAGTQVMDIIMVGTPAEALAALKTFEGTTFH